MKIEIPDEMVVPISALIGRVRHAREKHPQPYCSAHHALGVLAEEVREIEAQVFKRRLNHDHFHNECLDVAAVCIRACIDVSKSNPRP